MKFVKCDKCGKVMPITLVDSDYFVTDDNGNLLDERFVHPNNISETKVAGKALDLCTKCTQELLDKKKQLDEDFMKQCNIKQEV